MPSCCVHKFRHWLSISRLSFPHTQTIRQEGRIPRVTDRHHGHRFIALRDLTVRPRSIDQKTRHLMGNKPKFRGLQGEVFHRHPCVIERVAIGRTILEL